MQTAEMENSGRSGDWQVWVAQEMQKQPWDSHLDHSGAILLSNTATPTQTGVKGYVNCKVHCVMRGTSLYRCEIWTIKNAEHWSFRTVVLEKTLESPLDSKKIKYQSVLQEINQEYSLEGLLLKLKLQYFGHLMQTANSLAKTMMLEKIKGRVRKGWERVK